MNEVVDVLNLQVETIKSHESAHCAPNSNALMLIKKYSTMLHVIGLMFMLTWTGVLVYFTVLQKCPIQWFALSFIFKCLILFPSQYLLGYGVLHWEWVVGYTRKIIHVGFFLLPFILDLCLPLPKDNKWIWAIWNGNLICWMLAGVTKPVRKKFKFIRVMYAAVDRTEDRGLTQLYTIIQVPLSLFVIIGFTILLDVMNKEYWTLCPIISVTFGDGLAEPVAIYWKRHNICGGTHTYRTRGLCSGKRKFERSFEGSFTVFLFTALSVCIIEKSLSVKEFCVLLAVLPLTMTLLEMIAPHSMDNPFLLLWGYLIVVFVYYV